MGRPLVQLPQDRDFTVLPGWLSDSPQANVNEMLGLTKWVSVIESQR